MGFWGFGDPYHCPAPALAVPPWAPGQLIRMVRLHHDI